MHFCKNCGNKLEENQKFCPNCGKVLNSKDNAIKKSNLIIVLNILKYLFYFISFVIFFLIIALVISKINGACYENYCDNNLVIFISAFISCLLIAIICSMKINKTKNN